MAGKGEKRAQFEMHSYVKDANIEKCKPDSPQSKKKKDFSLMDLYNLINERSDRIESKVSENALLVEDLREKVDYIYNEVGGFRIEMDVLNQKCEAFQQKIANLEERLADAERYGRRWNLRLYGLSESSKEDVKSKVMEICRAVIPTFNTSTIDVAHRLGRLNGDNHRARPVIIRFISRSEKDILWRAAKNNQYLSSNKLQFKEDLTPGDRAARQRLWPEVERARKAGKMAYFVGAKAYVDGIQIRLKDDKMEN